MKEIENILLEKFHIKNHEDALKFYDDEPPIMEVTTEHYGHTPTAYDSPDPDEQLIVMTSETMHILRKMKEPVKKYGSTLLCDSCCRSISEMLFDGTVSNMYYGVNFDIEDGPKDIMQRITHSKQEWKAWAFLSKIEDGIPQILDKKAGEWALNVICGNCLTYKMPEYCVRRHEHNCDFDFHEPLLDYAVLSAKQAKKWKRNPNLYIEDYGKKNDKFFLKTSKDLHIYLDPCKEEEMKFLKNLGFTVRKDEDDDEYILL